jgi:hypothetical protein
MVLYITGDWGGLALDVVVLSIMPHIFLLRHGRENFIGCITERNELEPMECLVRCTRSFLVEPRKFRVTPSGIVTDLYEELDNVHLTLVAYMHFRGVSYMWLHKSLDLDTSVI